MACERSRFLVLCFLIACLGSQTGCATWLASGEEPPTVTPTHAFGSAVPTSETAGVETILIRLNASQAAKLPELWLQIDEQAMKPGLRIAMDKNGIRAGKVSGNVPPLLDEWLRQTVKRLADDPLEQAGFAADVSSYSQLWRCRANVRKELTLRNFPETSIFVSYHDDGSSFDGKLYDAPQFMFSIQATPHGDATATLGLRPEMQHGELLKKAIGRESVVRLDSRRESVVWEKLAIDVKLQQGDCVVLGPTTDSRALGEHFFHTKTRNGEIQPLLLLVRLSDADADRAFAPRRPLEASNR